MSLPDVLLAVGGLSGVAEVQVRLAAFLVAAADKGELRRAAEVLTSPSPARSDNESAWIVAAVLARKHVHDGVDVASALKAWIPRRADEIDAVFATQAKEKTR